MENRLREIARNKRKRQRQLRRRLAGGAALCAAGLAAFVAVWGLRGEVQAESETGMSDEVQRELETGSKTGNAVEAVSDCEDTARLEEMSGESMQNDSIEQPLPSRYDLREQKTLTAAPDQGAFATCWAFAALKAVETSVEETLGVQELAVDHMSLQNGFELDLDSGGNHAVASAYLLSWQGPVAAAVDPYGDGKTVEAAEPVYHVQEIQILPERDLEAVKRAVFETGGVQSPLYVPEETAHMQERYYNAETKAYYVSEESVVQEGSEANHEVLIVGWDDDYAKENFLVEPEMDGAFLCMNTWGDGFGSAGFFYVSYEDYCIGTDCVVYTGIESPQNYDRIYQTDLCGWTGQLGYGEPTAWFANVYEAEEALMLAAAGFYATVPDTKYKIYLKTENKTSEGALRAFFESDKEGCEENGEKPLNELLVAEGAFEYAGYYTVRFAEEYEVGPQESFAIIIEVDSPEAVEPVAIEYRADEKTAKVDIGDGEGYISFDGVNWERTETEYQCNVCLKVYADER